MDFINYSGLFQRKKENGCLQPSTQHYRAKIARDIIHFFAKK
jgi:hypothetical protein